MIFKEVREYAAGDDIRFIDWNVSARLGNPYSKLFEEERELTVMLLIDISGSAHFGTLQSTKRELAAQLGAVLAFSAINNGDKVGVVFYSDKVESFIPPGKGRKHGLYIVRQLITKEPESTNTHSVKALQYFNNVIRQPGIVFMLSDFLDAGYQDMLRVTAKKHDVIGIKLYDKMDMQLPQAGLLAVQDAEYGNIKWVDTDNERVRQNYQQEFFRVTDFTKELFKNAGADLLHIRTDEDYVKILQRFFKSRIRK